MPAHLKTETSEFDSFDQRSSTITKRPFPAWLQWILIFALAFGISLLIRTFIAEFYLIPSGSMRETIQEGDHVIGEKISYYMRDPKAGEVVTFSDPAGDKDILIKRVIATEGQTIDFKDGNVYVDGKMLDEPYTLGKPTQPLDEQLAGVEITYPYTVPKDCIWVMGDNRTNSLDSRYFGALHTSRVKSRAVWTYWPPSSWGAL